MSASRLVIAVALLLSVPKGGLTQTQADAERGALERELVESLGHEGYLAIPAESVEMTRSVKEGAAAVLRSSFFGRRIWWLAAREVGLELEFTNAQRLQALELPLKAAKRRNEMVRAYVNSRDGLGSALQLKEAEAQSVEEFTVLLTDVQVTRLRQLENRHAVLRLGIELGLRQAGMSLSESESEKIAVAAQLAQTERREVADENARRDASKIMGILNEKQRETLRERVGGLAPFISRDMSLKLWQLRGNSGVREHNGYIDEFFATNRRFRIGISGRLETYDVPETLVLERFIQTCQSQLYGPVVVLAEQIPRGKIIAERGVELQDSVEEVFASVANGEMTLGIAVNEMQRLLTDYERYKMAMFRDQLLPDQDELLRDAALRRLITLRGPVACMTNGTLGQLIGITVEQRNQLGELRAELLQAYEEKARKLEDMVWSTIRRTLSPRKQGEFERLFGAAPVNHVGAPDVILLKSVRLRP